MPRLFADHVSRLMYNCTHAQFASMRNLRRYRPTAENSMCLQHGGGNYFRQSDVTVTLCICVLSNSFDGRRNWYTACRL